MKTESYTPPNPLKKVQKLLLKWALLILLGLLSFAVGISLGYRKFAEISTKNQLTAASSGPVYNPNSTEPPK